MEESKKRFAPFIAYVIIFHAVWVGWVYLIYPRVSALGETTLLYALVNIIIRLLIWVLPVFLYLKYIDHINPFVYLKLKYNWQRGLWIGLVLTIINFLLSLIKFGLPHPRIESLTWNSIIGTSLLIGFVEEIPYRGFMLQKFQERFEFPVANLITSLLFLGIHLPGWVMLHLLSPETMLFVFVFGVIMGVIFYYSKSLWSVIVTHSMNDFLSFIIFRR